MSGSEIVGDMLSARSLASVLNQSVDCVKLITLDGQIAWMNRNGLCAMEIDDPSAVIGADWASLWPEESQPRVRDSLPVAAGGTPVRFRAFCLTMKGTDRWWDVMVSAVRDPQGRHNGYLAISRDVTESQLREETLDIATSELRHRLKNTYTMVASLIRTFARGDEAHSRFADDMTGRLVALARSQALFVDQDVPCRLDELVEALVSPFANQACTVTIDDVPALEITHGVADAIALAVGELAVNSSKHGALAHGGAIAVSCRSEPAMLSIVWAEITVGGVAATEREGGQGLALINRIMRARSGTLALAWRPDGLTATMSFTQG
jgi:PAS domain S-box-containing protein